MDSHSDFSQSSNTVIMANEASLNFPVPKLNHESQVPLLLNIPSSLLKSPTHDDSDSMEEFISPSSDLGSKIGLRRQEENGLCHDGLPTPISKENGVHRKEPLPFAKYRRTMSQSTLSHSLSSRSLLTSSIATTTMTATMANATLMQTQKVPILKDSFLPFLKPTVTSLDSKEVKSFIKSSGVSLSLRVEAGTSSLDESVLPHLETGKDALKRISGQTVSSWNNQHHFFSISYPFPFLIPNLISFPFQFPVYFHFIFSAYPPITFDSEY